MPYANTRKPSPRYSAEDRANRASADLTGRSTELPVEFEEAVNVGAGFFAWLHKSDEFVRWVLRDAREGGLDETDVRLLVEIGRHQREDSDEPTGSSLGALLGLKQPSASGRLRRLQLEGLVESQPGLFDRRRRVFRLTRAGQWRLVRLFARPPGA